MTKLPNIDAKELRALREALDLTQADMGNLLGTTRRAYWQWENNLRKPSGSVARLARLIEALLDHNIHIVLSSSDPNAIEIKCDIQNS